MACLWQRGAVGRTAGGNFWSCPSDWPVLLAGVRSCWIVVQSANSTIWKDQPECQSSPAEVCASKKRGFQHHTSVWCRPCVLDRRI
eukprot:scaffold14401_cov146-Skeletonema_marinoi.AAC.1